MVGSIVRTAIYIWLSSLFPGIPWLAQTVKSLLVTRETPVLSLGQEDPLEKEMVNHSSILAWKLPWMEEPGGLQRIGQKESDTTE